MKSEITGIITASAGGLYTVLTDADSPSGRIVACRARGVFRHNNEKPLVGDRVELSFEESADNISAVISKILGRTNALIRPPVANLDYIFVTMASAAPAPDTTVTDKLIAIAEFNHICPVIVIGKCELDRERAATLERTYRLAGYDVFVVSCHADEGISGADGLSAYIARTLPGHIAAFAGASGVGKSSLINKLFPGLELLTSDISRKTDRGRHTTRSVTLYPLTDAPDSGFLADTPGFSLLDFEHFDFFDKEDLPETFREFRDLLVECRYKKCTHTKEEGCAIIQAVKDGKIAASRHNSYNELYGILKEKHAWDKK